MKLRVLAIDDVGHAVRGLVLGHGDARPLPSYAPGSHVFVECGSRTNAYSLTGSGDRPADDRISVRHDVQGRGGSAWLLTRLAVGDAVEVSSPRSTFAPVANARHSLYVAGGIGVTPLLAHVRDAVRWQRPFTFLFVGRNAEAAHLLELRQLCGDLLIHARGRDEAWSALERLVRDQPVGTYLYTCGPQGLIDLVDALAGEAGWPGERVRSERFVTAAAVAGEPFDVLLARSGRRLSVPPDVTLLDSLLAAGVDVGHLCRQGVCGECRTSVRSGAVDHRDLVLTDAERHAGRDVMCCVSRGIGTLELDL